MITSLFRRPESWLIEMHPQINTEVNHDPLLTVTTIFTDCCLHIYHVHLDMFLYIRITLVLSGLRVTALLLHSVKAGRSQLLRVLCLYPVCFHPGIPTEWLIKNLFVCCTQWKKTTIGCTRGCLAEVSFEGFCANLSCWEMKDKQTERGRNSETLVWFAWNRFSMVPLIFTTCYLPTYMSLTIGV